MTTFILAVVLLALESSSGAGQSLLAVVSSFICAALVGHLVGERVFRLFVQFVDAVRTWIKMKKPQRSSDKEKV
jgi:hypothetical protein